MDRLESPILGWVVGRRKAESGKHGLRKINDRIYDEDS